MAYLSINRNLQFRWPSDPETKQKWIDSIRDANNSECTGTESQYVCSLHFPEEAIESNNGKNRLVNGAVPTEFWVEILETFDGVTDCDDTSESDTDLQMKYNDLRQSSLKQQMDFNVREASLQKKNHDLERTVRMQSQEISALKKSLNGSQMLIEQLKTKLVEAETSTNIKVNIYGFWNCWHSYVLLSRGEYINM